jgi:hypothetical protein
MSQSLLYHAFGVREGYEYRETLYRDGCVRFVLAIRPDWIKCPACGSQDIARKGRRFRELQTVPIGLKPVFLVTEIPKCKRRRSRPNGLLLQLCFEQFLPAGKASPTQSPPSSPPV